MPERFHAYLYTRIPRVSVYSNSDIWTEIKILHHENSALAVIVCFVAAALLTSLSPLTLPLVYCARHQGRVHLQALAPPSPRHPRTPYRLVNNYTRALHSATNNPVVHNFRVCPNQDTHSSKD